MAKLLDQLSELGLNAEVPDDEYVCDAILIIRTTKLDSVDGSDVRIATNTNMDWVTRRGLLSIAESIERGELNLLDGES